ncbi:MAG TPA: ATP-binding cassette domain-containing protein [Thermoanaerobaculia bacterium]|nr:ATP-binding cassette domain-containing protein [Thermoanaerobaculia bacterium]
MTETSARPPLLAAYGLAKSYGDKRVLAGIDFEVARGECLVVLGRSGSGKSVLLRQLNGLEKPDSGSVVFAGTELTDLEEEELFPLRRRMGMLFQGGALFDSMSVFDNVAFPLLEHGALAPDELAEKVEEKLGLVHLAGAGNKMPADLSGGMKKRAALARSLALDPELMLYDEPTTGLDSMTSAAIGSLIRRVEKQYEVASVVITHDLALARRVGDRLAFLAGGRFRFVGDWAAAESGRDRELADFLAAREEDEDAA